MVADDDGGEHDRYPVSQVLSKLRTVYGRYGQLLSKLRAGSSYAAIRYGNCGTTWPGPTANGSHASTAEYRPKCRENRTLDNRYSYRYTSFRHFVPNSGLHTLKPVVAPTASCTDTGPYSTIEPALYSSKNRKESSVFGGFRSLRVAGMIVVVYTRDVGSQEGERDHVQRSKE